MTIERAWDITNRFGSYMEASVVAPGTVADTSELPFPKELIKQALAIVFLESRDSNFREAIRVGYLELANYQPGIGPVRLGPDLRKMDLSDPLQSARQFLDESKAAEKWLAAVEAESKKLEKDLDRLNMEYALKLSKEY
jgi:hypothetical protein